MKKLHKMEEASALRKIAGPLSDTTGKWAKFIPLVPILASLHEDAAFIESCECGIA